MGDLYSDVAGPTTPAKSGVRDCVRVPFNFLPGAALATNDVVYLAKVSAGHRVVGYYIESPVASAAGSLVTIRTTDPSRGTPQTSLATGVAIGSAAGAAFGHIGSRTNTTSNAPLTFANVTAGCIPSPVFGKDGTFELVVTTAGTSPSASVQISGYIEVQPA